MILLPTLWQKFIGLSLNTSIIVYGHVSINDSIENSEV
jgi:hypothetical protein